jgi:hypothetical protein
MSCAPSQEKSRDFLSSLLESGMYLMDVWLHKPEFAKAHKPRRIDYVYLVICLNDFNEPFRQLCMTTV